MVAGRSGQADRHDAPDDRVPPRLEALVVFGALTGRDPRSLGENECSAFELGLSQPQTRALQRIAFEELARTAAVAANPLVLASPQQPARCAGAR